MSKEELRMYNEGRVIDGSNINAELTSNQLPMRITRDFIKSNINDFIEIYNNNN